MVFRIKSRNETPCNKSHAAAYAVLAYVTAWLKYYYPAEFMSALMNVYIKDKEGKVSRYIRHCKNDLGITILPPNINEGSEYFVALPNNKIVFSLNAKDTSIQSIRDIIAVKGDRFKSMEDFFEKTQDILGKTELEALSAIGAFDEFHVNRASYFEAAPAIKKRLSQIKAARQRAEKSKRQTRPIIFRDRFVLKDLVPDIPAWSNEERLTKEHYYLGMYVSGHPLDEYRFLIEADSNFKSSYMDYYVDEDTGDYVLSSPEFIYNGMRVSTIGLLTNLRPTLTRQKKEEMLILDVEDMEGSCRAVIFPRQYASLKDSVKENTVFRIEGEIKFSSEDAPTLIINNLSLVKGNKEKRAIFVLKKEQLKDALKVFSETSYKGETPVYLLFESMNVLLPREYWIDVEMFSKKEELASKMTVREW